MKSPAGSASHFVVSAVPRHRTGLAGKTGTPCRPVSRLCRFPVRFLREFSHISRQRTRLCFVMISPDYRAKPRNLIWMRMRRMINWGSDPRSRVIHQESSCPTERFVERQTNHRRGLGTREPCLSQPVAPHHPTPHYSRELWQRQPQVLNR